VFGFGHETIPVRRIVLRNYLDCWRKIAVTLTNRSLSAIACLVTSIIFLPVFRFHDFLCLLNGGVCHRELSSRPTLTKLTLEQAKRLVVERDNCSEEEAAEFLESKTAAKRNVPDKAVRFRVVAPQNYADFLNKPPVTTSII
jgi:hypothetical protein